MIPPATRARTTAEALAGSRGKGGFVLDGRGIRPEGVPALVFHAHRTNAALNSIEDLGTLGGDYSNAFSINFNANLNVTQVVGETERSNGRVVAFRYTDSRNPKMENLGALGGNNSTAWDINGTGGVTGDAEVIGMGPVPLLPRSGGITVCTCRTPGV